METINVKNSPHANSDQTSFNVPLAQAVKIVWSGQKLDNTKRLECVSFQVPNLSINEPCEIQSDADGVKVTVTLESHQTISSNPQGAPYALIGADDGRARLLRRGLFVPQ